VVQRGLETAGCAGAVWVGVSDDFFHGVWAELTTFLRGIQGEDGDFGGAVQPEGQAYGAETAVDVELHLVETVEAFGVLLAHGRQDKRTQEGEPDLATVGVAGKHEVDERTAWVEDDVVGEVGFMRHEEDGAVGFDGDGQIEVGAAGTGVVDTAEPEAGAVALDGEVLVDQNGSAMRGEGLDDGGGTEGDVVVTEDGVAEGGGEGGEDLGTAVKSMAAGDEGEGSVSDEVAGEEDEVGSEGVDLADDVFEEEWLGVLVEVDVADLNDAVSVEGSGQIGDGDGAIDHFEFVACDLAGVKSKSGGGGSGAYEEVASGET
jgi:hypothetical protein